MHGTSRGIMVGTDVVFAMRRMRIDSIIIGCSGNDIDDLFKEAGTGKYKISLNFIMNMQN